jgi:hypothetical protein
MEKQAIPPLVGSSDIGGGGGIIFPGRRWRRNGGRRSRFYVYWAATITGPIGSDASQKHPHTQAASYYFCLIWHVKNVFFPAIISMLCSHYPPIPSA